MFKYDQEPTKIISKSKTKTNILDFVFLMGFSTKKYVKMLKTVVSKIINGVFANIDVLPSGKRYLENTNKGQCHKYIG